MNKKRVCILIALSLLLLCRAGEAFVPKTPHLLYMVIQKIKQPVGIEAYQTRKIVNYTETVEPYVEFEEKLIYAFPGRFRSEMMSQNISSFSIEAMEQFVKVVDGMVVSRDKSLLEFYVDILLYRNYETLTQRLGAAGVDTHRVGMERYKDTICYVIGESEQKGQPFSGLWIEKDTFLPMKYVIINKGWAVEFLYDRWQKFSKTWYPMQTAIFLDDRLHAMVNVKSVALKLVKSDALFDIEYVIRAYPAKESAEPVEEQSRQVDELENSINDFEKLFE